MALTAECMPIQTQLIFPMCKIDVVAPDHFEHDFSDIFGPVPVQAPVDSVEDSTGLINNDPVIIHSRSHSSIGLCHLLKLNKLTICDKEDSGEAIVGGTPKNIKESLVKSESVGIKDFEVLKMVGDGVFAKVYQVRKKGTSEIYAMKVIRKHEIMEAKMAEYMKAERDILTKVDHPFIVKLRYSFQTKYRLYLVMDFVNGGQLFVHLYQHGLFLEELARVYVTKIFSGISHLHSNGIMHRDLKPENIRWPCKCDRLWPCEEFRRKYEVQFSNIGTVEYMAPEIVLGTGHDKAADWWSVGILLFEMLTGWLPFSGNRRTYQEKIVKEKIVKDEHANVKQHSTPTRSHTNHSTQSLTYKHNNTQSLTYKPTNLYH